MRLLGAAFLVPLLLAAQENPSPQELERLLRRVAEEAEVFYQKAPRIVGRETLTHQGRLEPPRIRWGASRETAGARTFTREITSEYGFAALRDKPEWIREFRQVVSVDGRAVLAERTNPRQALAEGMTSEDDRRRMTLLREFAKYGQTGAATDFGQSILLFRSRQLALLDFRFVRREFSGADEAVVIEWRQKEGSDDAARVYSARRLERVRMEGTLAVREADGVPLRITLALKNTEYDTLATHAAAIDYAPSRYGVLLPVSVHYRKLAQRLTPGKKKNDPPVPGPPRLIIDNLARYADWQMFAADANIKFIPIEPEPPER